MRNLYYSTKTLDFQAKRDLIVLATELKMYVPLATLLEFVGRVP